MRLQPQAFQNDYDQTIQKLTEYLERDRLHHGASVHAVTEADGEEVQWYTDEDGRVFQYWADDDSWYVVEVEEVHYAGSST